MKTRAGEEVRAWFRVDRFYHTNDGWWFQTREKEELGPFASHAAAEQGMMLYLHRKRLALKGGSISRICED